MLEKVKIIWKNKAQIWKGFLNWIHKTDSVENVYDKRWSLCKACPHLDKKGSLCTAPGTQPCCGICGCSLAFKLRSLDSACPHPEGPRWKEEKV